MKIGFLSDLHIMHNTNMIEEALDVVCQAAKSAEIDKLFITRDTSESHKTTLDFVDLLSGADITPMQSLETMNITLVLGETAKNK